MGGHVNGHHGTYMKQFWYFIYKTSRAFDVPIHPRALLAAILCCLVALNKVMGHNLSWSLPVAQQICIWVGVASLCTCTRKERTLPLIVSSSILCKQLWHRMKLCCQWFVRTWKYLWAKSSNLVLLLLYSYKPVCRNCKKMDCVHGDYVHGLWEDIDVAAWLKAVSGGALCLHVHSGWKIAGKLPRRAANHFDHFEPSESLW